MVNLSIINVWIDGGEKAEMKLKTICIYTLTLMFLFTVMIFALKDTPLMEGNHALSRISKISLDDPTTQVRLMTWDIAWQGIKEKPLLGWGQENFIVVYSKYFNPELFAIETWVDRSHNVVLDWFINAGIFGLLFYLSLFVALFYKLRMPTRIGTFVVLSGVIAYFVQNLFVFDNINTYIMFFTVLAYASRKGE